MDTWHVDWGSSGLYVCNTCQNYGWRQQEPRTAPPGTLEKALLQPMRHEQAK